MCGKAADANSSLLLKEPGEPDSSGHLTLVADDEKTGHQAVLVVIEGGKVIAKQPLTVGEN